jgi:hypothetical protein
MLCKKSVVFLSLQCFFIYFTFFLDLILWYAKLESGREFNLIEGGKNEEYIDSMYVVDVWLR